MRPGTIVNRPRSLCVWCMRCWSSKGSAWRTRTQAGATQASQAEGWHHKLACRFLDHNNNQSITVFPSSYHLLLKSIFEIRIFFLSDRFPSNNISGPVQTTPKLSEKLSENQPFAFRQKMQFGYKRCKNYLIYYLKQTETERKARLNLVCMQHDQPKYSPIPEHPSVPAGVSLCSSWPFYPIIRQWKIKHRTRANDILCKTKY